jgi:hypothetical protein
MALLALEKAPFCAIFRDFFVDFPRVFLASLAKMALWVQIRPRNALLLNDSRSGARPRQTSCAGKCAPRLPRGAVVNHDAIKVDLDASPMGMRHAQRLMRPTDRIRLTHMSHAQGRSVSFARRIPAPL